MNGMKKENKRKKKKLGQILWVLLFFTVVNPMKGLAEETEETAEIVLYLPEEEIVPKEQYIDESGQKYWLKSCQQVERLVPEYQESVSEFRIYTGLEASGQIPERIRVEIPDEEGGRIGTGELTHQETTVVAQYWSDDFSVPIIFYDYDADQFVFQELEVPKGSELQYLLENQNLFLQKIGCSQENYEIQNITWDGESYLNQGICCRNARAEGRKRVADYQAGFQGTVRYPETIKTEWEAVYYPVLEVPETIPEPEPEETVWTEESTEALLTASEPEPEPTKFWQIVRTLALYTVSLAVVLPILFYLILLMWRKQKQKDRSVEGLSQ